MINMIHSLGVCRVCQNGELVFSRRSDSSEIIVECLECMTGYADPRDLLVSGILRLESVDWETQPASLEEVKGAGFLAQVVDDR